MPLAPPIAEITGVALSCSPPLSGEGPNRPAWEPRHGSAAATCWWGKQGHAGADECPAAAAERRAAVRCTGLSSAHGRRRSSARPATFPW